MKHELKPGDVVMLKSGGPKMTVSRIDEGDDDDDVFVCAWFSENGEDPGFRTDEFNEHELQQLQV